MYKLYTEILDKENLELTEPYIDRATPITVKCKICQLTFSALITSIIYKRHGKPYCKKCRGGRVFSKEDLLLATQENNVSVLNQNIPYTIPIKYNFKIKCNICSHEWTQRFRITYKQMFLCPVCAKLPKDSSDIIKGIIYKATCLNNKVYVGQTIQPLYNRKCKHFKMALDPTSWSYNTKFARAIRQYGPESFTWEILHKETPWNMLNKLEIEEIAKHDSYNNGYNSTNGGQDELTAVAAKRSYEKRKQRIKLRDKAIKEKHEQKSISNFEKNIESALKRFQKEKLKIKSTETETQIKRTISGKKKYRDNIPDSSQYRGVCFDKQNNKWKANIKHLGKKIHIGLFGSEDAAAKAYDVEAKRLHGVKAKLNFP